LVVIDVFSALDGPFAFLSFFLHVSLLVFTFFFFLWGGGVVENGLLDIQPFSTILLEHWAKKKKKRILYPHYPHRRSILVKCTSKRSFV
jgi:hypothetical protein